MRRMSSKWISVLGGLVAFILAVGAIAALPGCDHSNSDEDEQNITIN
jgi:hypothetical protein